MFSVGIDSSHACESAEQFFMEQRRVVVPVCNFDFGENYHGCGWLRRTLLHWVAIAFAIPMNVFDRSLARSFPGEQQCTFALSEYGSDIISG